MLKEYLDLAEQYPTPMRMVRGHTFGLIGQCLVSLITTIIIYNHTDHNDNNKKATIINRSTPNVT